MTNKVPIWADYAYEIKSEDDCERKIDATFEQVDAWAETLLAEIDAIEALGKMAVESEHSSK